MEFLRKAPEISWSTFVIILFGVVYATAVVTVLGMYGQFESVALLLGVLFLTSLVLMTFAFGFSRLVGRVDIIDMMWGVVIVVLAAASFLANPEGVDIGLNTQTVATLLVTIWGVRLVYHITRRLLKTTEDPRYKALRKKWRGGDAINSYVRVFVVQAVLAVVVAAAVICINTADETAIGVWAWIGVGVWMVGFLCESIGDWQLKRFLERSSSKNALMTSGLWRYTRHPNYFGEAVQWWGIWIMALSLPFGWMGIISPIVITYLLLCVSGVPLAERRAARKHGWKAYMNRTSMFIPRLPREN